MTVKNIVTTAALLMPALAATASMSGGAQESVSDLAGQFRAPRLKL